MMVTLLIERLYEIETPPATGHPVLTILEEFPVLGHLEVIEQAAGYAAGFGLKLWIISQDLTQLKRHYRESWETFLGNAGVIQAFANSDVTTLEYLSKKLGECEFTRTVKSTNISHCMTSNDPGAQHQAQSFLHERGEMGIITNPLSLLISPQGSGENVTTTEPWNTQVQHTPLMRADEIERFFAREHLSQIVMIKGQRPMILYRVDSET